MMFYSSWETTIINYYYYYYYYYLSGTTEQYDHQHALWDYILLAVAEFECMHLLAITAILIYTV